MAIRESEQTPNEDDDELAQIMRESEREEIQRQTSIKDEEDKLMESLREDYQKEELKRIGEEEKIIEVEDKLLQEAIQQSEEL